MADEEYNTSTDNVEKKEAPRLNPSVNIANFARGENILKQHVNQQKQVQSLEDYKRQADEEKQRQIEQERKQLEKNKKQFQTLKKEKKPKGFFQVLGLTPKQIFIRKHGKRPIRDRLKVLRLQNMLEKKRLLNQIEKFKLQRRVEVLKKKGQLGEVIARPMITSKPLLYPAYATPEVMGDIDSAFNSDIGHGDKSLYGDENYYDENYYDEDFFGNEFANPDPFYQLAVKVKQGVSPLLW